MAALPPAGPTATGDFDQDGIPDGADLCPHQAEDADGFEDQDGCADPDNDKDRIPDASDKCPTAPEAYNGVDDEDGCPDVGRVIKIGPCKVEIRDKILFAKNAATVPEEATPVLDAIARTMELNPLIQSLEVQGHAARDERCSSTWSRSGWRATGWYWERTRRSARRRPGSGRTACSYSAGAWSSSSASPERFALAQAPPLELRRDRALRSIRVGRPRKCGDCPWGSISSMISPPTLRVSPTATIRSSA